MLSVREAWGPDVTTERIAERLPTSEAAQVSDAGMGNPAVQASGARIAYLVNGYPKVSHSFIRREIHALERQGCSIMRIAVRGWDETLADPADRAERTQTRYLLKEGMISLVVAAAKVAVRKPGQFWKALRLVFKLGSNADRPLPFHFIYLLQACQLATWLEAHDVRHLHAHFGTNPAEVALLAHVLSGIPYSFTVHGPDEFDRGVYLHLDDKIAHAKFVAAVNAYCRSQLLRRARFEDWDKVKVVHCGLDSTFLNADAGPLAADSQRFVCVGRLCEQKGQLLLLEAFSRIARQHPKAHLVLAGDGEMRAELEASIARLDLRDRTTITGWISEAQVREEIRLARALVLPSFAESLPVVIMEAMALRRPVISTYVAGIPELVRNGETGWLVPAGSVESLCQAMQNCLAEDASRLGRMGDLGYERVSARHSADHEAQRLLALINAVGGSSKELTEWVS